MSLGIVGGPDGIAVMTAAVLLVTAVGWGLNVALGTRPAEVTRRSRTTPLHAVPDPLPRTGPVERTPGRPAPLLRLVPPVEPTPLGADPPAGGDYGDYGDALAA